MSLAIESKYLNLNKSNNPTWSTWTEWSPSKPDAYDSEYEYRVRNCVLPVTDRKGKDLRECTAILNDERPNYLT